MAEATFDLRRRTAWLGLIQRIAIAPFMLWVFIFALGLQRRSKTI